MTEGDDFWAIKHARHLQDVLLLQNRVGNMAQHYVGRYLLRLSEGMRLTGREVRRKVVILWWRRNTETSFVDVAVQTASKRKEM